MTLVAHHTPLALPPVARRAKSDPVARRWYAPHPEGNGWQPRAGRARAAVPSGWLDALLPAMEPVGAALQRIRAAAENGIVVTTGQQPGLFGGPMYTWLKALTALALADELQSRLEIPVAPVFWAATDDSDLAEATVTTVSVPGGWEQIVLERKAGRDTPVAVVPVGDVSEALKKVYAASGSAPHAAILELLREAYYPGNTLGGAYVRLLRGVLEPFGITVLDAAHPATRAAASPVLMSALERAHDVAGMVQQRSEEIRAKGLRTQVRPVPGRTLVFSVNGARRRRILLSEAATFGEGAGPSDLSPSVLLRPVVERCILPTVAYVGGPAEIAYFAQVGAVADALHVEPPLVVPRWSGFLIEPHVQRAMDSLGVTLEELRDPHVVESRVAREELPGEVQEVLAGARDSITGLGERLTGAVRSAELPLQDATIRGAMRQLEHKLDRLDRRLVAAVKRRGSVRLQLLATARGALFPGEQPQERALNLIPLLARYGDDPLDSVLAAARSYVKGV
ncbi:MAG TPA: bacillithiol biosynthesis cysteine-adding enzyme BshC [Gemmatimonadaceae bacterium]|nr:bacillithiol biosynthesis cysteine-adding enzyme BshC [Gemmatimonadaceae bacterium]